MSDPSPGTRVSRLFRRLPTGFLGMLAIVVAVESYLYRERETYCVPGSQDLQLAWKAAGSEALGRDVLCFGDSLMKFSMIPKVFEQRTGLTCYNMAVAGSQTPITYCLLRKALESGAKPRAIVVEFIPTLFRLPPTHNLSLLSYVVDLSDALEMAWRENNRVLFDRVLMNKVLTSMEARVGIRRLFMAWLLGPVAVPDEVPLYRRHWIEYDGAQIMPPKPEFTENGFDPSGWAKDFYPNWYVNRVNRAYLLKFLDLAKAHDIEVYWFLPPIMPSIEAECDRSGFSEKHTAFLQAMQKRYSNLSIIDGRNAGYDEKIYSDGNHLGRPGAYVVSFEVGGLLRDRLRQEHAPPAWLNLPPYQARPVDVAIHDVYHSTPIQTRDAETRTR